MICRWDPAYAVSWAPNKLRFPAIFDLLVLFKLLDDPQEVHVVGDIYLLATYNFMLDPLSVLAHELAAEKHLG